MKIEFRLITASVIALVLVSAALAEGARSRPLNEDAAMELLYRTLKRDGVYEKRISWDCISSGTEETTDAYFDFVLREIHDAKCGGDPVIMHVIDRYRVFGVLARSSSGKRQGTNGCRTRSTRRTRPGTDHNSHCRLVDVSSVRKSRPLKRARS
jgi:hypothetical protein